MKTLKPAYLSARVSEKTKERLEFLAVWETRSVSQLASWAIEEGLPLLEKQWAERYPELTAKFKDVNPYVDTKEFLSRNPYDAKAIAAKASKRETATVKPIRQKKPVGKR